MAITVNAQTWEGQRLAAFNAQYAINGTTLTHNGSPPIPALCPSKEVFKEMQRIDYTGRRTATFTIRRSDFESLFKTPVLACKKVIETNGVKMMIESTLDDDAEPTVDLKCNLLQ
jgi:hypothetical protein